MLKNCYIAKKIRCPSIGGMSPVLETNLSPIPGTFSLLGDCMKKCHILGILRLSCAFYYEKAHVKTSWEARPKFNPLHQRNSLLRLVQRYGTDPGIVTRLKTWKNGLFSS